MKREKCSVSGCPKTSRIVLGLCRKHYYLYKRYGHPLFKLKKKSNRTQLRNQLISLLGSKCVKCGISDIRILQIGHKNSDGNIDRKKHKGDYAFYKFYVSNPILALQILELLCANDNLIAKFENKEWCNQYTKFIRYPDKKDDISKIL